MPVRSVQPPSLLQNESVSKARGDKSAQAVSLHPSWLAKQKQKEALATTDSAGSKTVVSDDGQPVAPRRASAASTDTSGAPPVRHKQQSEQKAMPHPPWLAKKAAASKQAQHASCSAATEITFEHWVAKVFLGVSGSKPFVFGIARLSDVVMQSQSLVLPKYVVCLMEKQR